MTLKRLGALGLLCILLAMVIVACAPVASPPATIAPVVRAASPYLRVQCLYKGELVFDQTFDSATLINGSIIVWIGAESTTIEPAIGETCWIEKVER